jgi:hypothetical protein
MVALMIIGKIMKRLKLCWFEMHRCDMMNLGDDWEKMLREKN